VDDDGPLGEADLVAAAAEGSEDAFRRLVEPLRGELHAFCYRMLGSFHDTEDVLQEAQFKAWRALATFDGRASFRSWIFSIAANATVDALRSRRRRVLPQDLGDARDPSLGLGDQRNDLPWLEPYADSLLGGSDPAQQAEIRQSVKLAFMRALQLLPPRQRAVLILRDVLDWKAAEVADALETSIAAVHSASQRARATVAQARPSASVIPTLDSKKAEMAERYVAAWESGDIDEVVAMLAADAVHAMPPWNSWFVGRDALRTVYSSYEIWNGDPGPGVFRIIPVALNGEQGFAEYCRLEPGGPYQALALTVVEFDRDGTHMTEKVSFVWPDLFGSLGLPEVLK
jgi:RNA polymerase sigma-70 factor (ECF subfamily)